MENALVIMAKAPIPGMVKTRLLSSMGVKEAADFYECLLKDTFEMAKRVRDVDRYIAYYPEGGGDYFNKTEMFIPLLQRGSDLGERLINVFTLLFSKGYLRVVVIGSDSPTLPQGYIEDAFKSLNQYPLVLGPCRDGGYYLLGMRVPFYRVFEEIPWGTSSVLKVTLERAKEGGYKIYLLPEWYDIDTIEDIEKILKDIKSGNYPWLKHTRDFLKCYSSSP